MLCPVIPFDFDVQDISAAQRRILLIRIRLCRWSIINFVSCLLPRATYVLSNFKVYHQSVCNLCTSLSLSKSLTLYLSLSLCVSVSARLLWLCEITS